VIVDDYDARPAVRCRHDFAHRLGSLGKAWGTTTRPSTARNRSDHPE
jgi:hypothetical protein